MRKLTIAAVAALFAVFSAGSFAGVAPNHGAQGSSGAKIKPANHDAEKSEQASEKEEQNQNKDDKR